MMKKLPQWLTSKNVFLALISLLWIVIFVSSYADSQFDYGAIAHKTGEWAWRMLILTIFISLFQKIAHIHFPKIKIFSKLLPLRKYSGIFAFLFALVHGIANLLKMGILGDFPAILEETFSTHHAMVFGTISLLIMLPLFLTSTNWAIQKMGAKSWKNLQRFTHLAFIFAALHILLLDFFGRGVIDLTPAFVLLIYLIGYAYLFLITKK